MLRILRCSFIAALLGIAVSSAHAQATAWMPEVEQRMEQLPDAPRYAVSFDGKSLQIDVHLCLAQAHAHVRFAADSDSTMRFVHDMRRTGDGAVEEDDGEWSTADWYAGECLSYQADLAAIAAVQDPDIGWGVGDDLVSAPQL